MQPTPGELLLLRAATLDRPQALAAWKRWCAEADTRDGRYRPLFGLVWRNLADGLRGDPLERMLRVQYESTWAQNQSLHHRAARVLAALEAAGIDALVLKGAALSALCYRDQGVRSMFDIDVLVRRHHLLAAVTILRRLGWRSDHQNFERSIGVLHAENFTDPEGRGRVDLHWRALFLAGREEDTWRSAVLVEVAGQPVLAPSPADQLLHVCAHGVLLKRVADAGWIADALVAVRTGVDWELFAHNAAERRLSVIARASLTVLTSAFPGSVPELVLDRLDVAPSTRIERWAHGRALRGHSPAGSLLLDFDRYARIRRGGWDGNPAVSFPCFVLRSHHFDGWKAQVRRSRWQHR